MSKTAEVTPYQDPEQERKIAEAAWEAAVVARHREEKRRALVQAPSMTGLTGPLHAVRHEISRVKLQQLDLDGLKRAVARLGYQWQTSSTGGIRLIHRQRSDANLELVKHRQAGLELIGTPKAIAATIRSYTVEQAVRHLKAQGREVALSTLPNGDIQVVGQRGSRRPGRVTAMIRRSGTLEVDVSCVKGKRCEKEVADFARAIGGTVRASQRKAEYYQDENTAEVRIHG